MSILDASLSRPLEGGPSFTLSHRLYRLLWQVAWLGLAAWTPPPFRRWRRLVLVLFGARVASSADVRASARVWFPPHLTMDHHALMGPGVVCYNIAPVTIGAYAVVSQRAHLCTGSHDLTDPHFQLVARPIAVRQRAWIAAEAFVGPGVTVGVGAVLGARGAAFKDLAPLTVYRGNPAVPVAQRALGGSDSHKSAE